MLLLFVHAVQRLFRGVGEEFSFLTQRTLNVGRLVRRLFFVVAKRGERGKIEKREEGNEYKAF